MTRGLAALRRFARGAAGATGEVCDLCGALLPAGHPHLLALSQQRLACACGPCALLFPGQGQAYRRIESRAEPLPAELLDDAAWAALDLPIGLVFFVRSSHRDEVLARYPGPAGAVEAALPPGLWSRLAAREPTLGALQADVEALLVRRLDGRRECWRVSVDHCFHLVGLIRSRWRGLSGGREVEEAVGWFFAALGEGS